MLPAIRKATSIVLFAFVFLVSNFGAVTFPDSPHWASLAFAKKKDDDEDRGKKNGIPFLIKKLKQEIRDLQHEIDTIDLTPGAEGPEGPQGPQGETGPQGPAGPQGPQGATGPQGAQGDKGDKGDQGPQGVAGVKGDPGDKGDKGVPGPQGPQGLKGDKGEKGDSGIQGVAGAKGDQGEKGDPGIQGVAGIQGDKGDQGLKGDKGDTGLQGFTGNAGPAGPAGPEGPEGPQGVPGHPEDIRLTYVSEKPGLVYIPPVLFGFGTPPYADVSDRVLDYTKHSGTSILRITYHDMIKLEGLAATTILNLRFILQNLADGAEVILPVEPIFVRRMVQHIEGESFSTLGSGPKTFHFILDPQFLGAKASFLAAGDYSLRIQAYEENFNGDFQTTSIGDLDYPFLMQVEEIEQ